MPDEPQHPPYLEESEDRTVRDTRDRLQGLTIDGARVAQNVLGGMYGDGMVREPMDINRVFLSAIERLESPDYTLPAVQSEHCPSWTKEALTAWVKSQHHGLDDVLASVDREVEETKSARIRKWQAMAECSDAITDLAQYLVLLARMSGEEELAERLRPWTRSGSASASKEEDDAAGGGSSETPS